MPRLASITSQAMAGLGITRSVVSDVVSLDTPVSGGLMTFNFVGNNGDTTTTVSSGSLSPTVTLYNSTISNFHSDIPGGTCLQTNGSPSNTSARLQASGLSINPTSFTLEGWFYFYTFNVSTTSNIFSIGANSQNLLNIKWLDDTTIGFGTYVSGSSVLQGSNSTASATPAIGQWQHHAITADGTNYRYYLDGVLIATSTSNGTYGYGATSGAVVTDYAICNWLDGPFAGNWSAAWVWNCRYSDSVVYSNNFTVDKTGVSP